MAVKVVMPNKAFNKVRAGVRFRGGVGIFEDEKAAKRLAEEFGYKIEKVKDEKAEEEQAKEEDGKKETGSKGKQSKK